MSYTAELVSVTSTFEAQWAALTPVAWPNVKFDPDEYEEWVRLVVLNGDANQASMGNDVNLHRFQGTVVVQIFVEPNSGAKRARELADTVCNMFRGKYVDNLLFRTPSQVVIGVVEGRYQINVNCPFHRDDIV